MNFFEQGQVYGSLHDSLCPMFKGPNLLQFIADNHPCTYLTSMLGKFSCKPYPSWATLGPKSSKPQVCVLHKVSLSMFLRTHMYIRPLMLTAKIFHPIWLQQNSFFRVVEVRSVVLFLHMKVSPFPVEPLQSKQEVQEF